MGNGSTIKERLTRLESEIKEINRRLDEFVQLTENQMNEASKAYKDLGQKMDKLIKETGSLRGELKTHVWNHNDSIIKSFEDPKVQKKFNRNVANALDTEEVKERIQIFLTRALFGRHWLVAILRIAILGGLIALISNNNLTDILLNKLKNIF